MNLCVFFFVLFFGSFDLENNSTNIEINYKSQKESPFNHVFNFNSE